MAETKLKRGIYNHAPVFVQNLMASIYGARKIRRRYAHPDAKKWREFYEQTAHWSDETLREYQVEQLRQAMHYAYEHVPFYRRRFDAAGVRPGDIGRVEDLACLPYLTKDDIRAAGTDLISDEFAVSDLDAHPTSGSTGMPLTLYSCREGIIRNYAIHSAQCRPGMVREDGRYKRYANFTGLEIVDPARKKPPFWRMNYAAQQRLYSIFHMSDETMPLYLEDLARFRPVWLYGYPSALYTLADFMLRTGYEYPHPIEGVVTSSEQCLPHFREAIETAFQTRLWDEYGQGEMAGLAFECECGKLHVKEEYALMEFVPTGRRENGCDVFELICTSFINPGWPLVRYQVGDLALVAPEARCPLGKGGRVVEEIAGRTAHVIQAADGSRISNISVIVKKCVNVRALQAVQERKGEVTLRVVRQPEFRHERDEPRMIAEFRKKFGDESRMKIRVEYVDQVELTSSGKFLMIVSKVPNDPASQSAAD